MKYLLVYFLIPNLIYSIDDPFASLSFNDDCETMKKKNPEKKIKCDSSMSNQDKFLDSLH